MVEQAQLYDRKLAIGTPHGVFLQGLRLNLHERRNRKFFEVTPGEVTAFVNSPDYFRHIRPRLEAFRFGYPFKTMRETEDDVRSHRMYHQFPDSFGEVYSWIRMVVEHEDALEDRLRKQFLIGKTQLMERHQDIWRADLYNNAKNFYETLRLATQL